MSLLDLQALPLLTRNQERLLRPRTGAPLVPGSGLSGLPCSQ
jgi:hypothetical protein